MLRTLQNFARNQAAVSAVEFALIMPLVAFVILAEFDTYRYVMATQRVEIVAASVAQMVASAGVSSSAVTPGNGVIGDSDLHFFTTSEYFLYPDILTSPAVQSGTPLSVALEIDTAAIKMVKQPDGSYKPKTAWSAGGSNTYVRPCGANYSAVPNASTPSPTTLPADVIGPNSLIVVDLHTTFQPTFGASFLPSVPIVRSVFMTPRNVPFVEFNGTWMATNCP